MAAQKNLNIDPGTIAEKITNYLNGNITQINTNLDNGIIANNMDPWGQAAHGSSTLKEINLGFCKAEANGNFAVQNLTGLSTLNISEFNISDIYPQSEGSDIYYGVGSCDGTIDALSAGLYGYVRAHCGALGDHVDPTGSISIGGISFTLHFNVSGTLDTSDNEFCVNSLNFPSFENFDLLGNVDVQINGLGIFQSLLEPIINWVTNNLIKSVLASAIEVAITNNVNQELNSNLPICISLGSDATKPNLEIEKKEGPEHH